MAMNTHKNRRIIGHFFFCAIHVIIKGKQAISSSKNLLFQMAIQKLSCASALG
jgi:hypothetical protein